MHSYERLLVFFIHSRLFDLTRCSGLCGLGTWTSETMYWYWQIRVEADWKPPAELLPRSK